MNQVSTIGVDLAKSVFQLHGVDAAGEIVLRRQLRRGQMLEFFQNLSPCLIGMEACAGSHYWARELARFGHDVRLMQPSYVKGYVKRGSEADKKSWMDPRFPAERCSGCGSDLRSRLTPLDAFCSSQE